MAKIDLMKIALMVGISIVDVVAGFYDRLVNNIGAIKWACDELGSITEESIWSSAAQQPSEIDLIASVGSINPITVITFIAVMVAVFFIVGMTCRGAGMQ